MTGLQPLIVLIRLECWFQDLRGRYPLIPDSRRARRAYLVALGDVIHTDLPTMQPPKQV